jgi:hypothetical protein
MSSNFSARQSEPNSTFSRHKMFFFVEKCFFLIFFYFIISYPHIQQRSRKKIAPVASPNPYDAKVI